MTQRLKSSLKTVTLTGHTNNLYYVSNIIFLDTAYDNLSPPVSNSAPPIDSHLNVSSFDILLGLL